MNSENIKLAAVGDIALTHKYEQLLSEKGPNYPFEKVKDFLKNHEIVFGNLEAPISLNGETYPLKCSLRSNPDYVVGLKNAGFNILSLANNHILDYKEEGFYETFENLDRHRISWFGAGRNIQEAIKPSVVEIKGVRIGFLGYCDVVIDSPFYASIDERGITPLKVEYIEEDVANLNKHVDVLIVSLHWGMENWSYPSPHQIDLAHKIIDLGVDLILGHHPHVSQGIEKYRNGYIAYSLGNFVFPDINWSWINEEGKKLNFEVRLKKINRESFILTAKLGKRGVYQVKIVPCSISENLQPVIRSDCIFLIEKIKKLSDKLYIKNYSSFWRRYLLLQKYRTLFSNNIKRIRNIHRLRPAHLKQLYNMIRA